MPSVKSKDELMKMPQAQLVSYIESLDDNTYNGYIGADAKVRYFLIKFGNGVLNSIKGTGLFFPAVIAQSITESGYGRRIPKDSNNFGGIKYNPKLPGVVGYVETDTSEIIKGRRVIVKEKFSKFKDVESGFKAHINVLLADRYKDARLKAKSPEEQILMIARVGYTTTPPNEYLNTMKANINRVRDTTKIARVI
jgi:flagellum-specific peptidoglycan hydrolase FlgJ